jgi:hypothetical protein
MKKQSKKAVSFFITLSLIFSLFTLYPLQASAMTNQEGANWALARVGQWIDTDGYYGAQCKDFVNAFTQENFGITFPGNACDLIYDALPSGWQRIQNYAEFIPEPGDIAIWGGWNGNPYGHTGIIISANINTFESVDQNWVNSSSNGSAAARVTHNYTRPAFWGVIRPPYQANIPAVSGTWLTVNGSTFIAGSTVTFNLGANNANGYTIGIDKDGTRIITQGVGTNPSFVLNEPGNYSAYVTAGNSVSYQDSARVYFRVFRPENLGTDFYALILNKNAWKPIGSTDDNNVTLQSEQGISNQLWKFERQSDSTYEIKNTKTGYNLDVYCCLSANGTNIQVCGDNNSTAQHWYISSENGGYVFIPKCAINSVMDLTGGSTTDGNNIQLYEHNGTAAQIFAIYGQDDVQLKSAVLSVTPGNSKTNTAFNWTKTYGESYYSLKIWNGKELVGEPYYIDSNIPKNTLAKEIQLQPGYYEAYVDAVNYFNCKKSNTVSFTVKPTVKTYIDKTKTSITLEWEQVLNAKSYKVNIYNKDTDELVLSKENIETADCSFTLPNGSYYIVISSDNNVSSDKKYMIVNMNYAKSIIGDINYDGYITMEDVELLTQYLATGNYIDKRIADVNNDELIDVADAIQISRFINGNDTNYNIGKEITLDSLLGDLNSDGKISVNDVTELQMYISQSKDFSDEQKMLADYNQDGIIDVLDVTDIQQLIANS